MKTFEHFIEVTLLTAVLCAIPLLALSLPEPIRNNYASLEQVGEGKYKFLFMKVYNIKLFQNKETATPQALHIDYFMDLKAEKRLKRAVKDIKSQNLKDAPLADWEAQMRTIFPNVKKGESITIVRDANGISHFYHNDTLQGAIMDPAYTEAFFNIWLGENSGLKSIRNKLLKDAYHK